MIIAVDGSQSYFTEKVQTIASVLFGLYFQNSFAVIPSLLSSTILHTKGASAMEMDRSAYSPWAEHRQANKLVTSKSILLNQLAYR